MKMIKSENSMFTKLLAVRVEEIIDKEVRDTFRKLSDKISKSITTDVIMYLDYEIKKHKLS